MLTAIAIDDEPMALEVIKSHSAKIPLLDLKASFTDATLALEFLRANPVHLIFLDIKMPDISGLEMATLIPKDTMVVFTTAYSEHAVKSFELDAVDYLLKPFSLGRFMKSYQKAAELHQLKNGPTYGALFVKTGVEQVKIRFEELLYCEAQGNYVCFYSKDQKVLSRMTLAEAEKLLPSAFVRSHRSFIINPQHIEKIEKHQVTLMGKTVPLSGSYYEAIMERLPKS
jgi:two-component system, LytTR family, response regulator